MSVKTKFRVTSITRHEGGVSVVNLSTVTSGSPENDHFFKWTPNGRIELGMINDSAVAQFDVGSEYYVDFSRAESSK